MPRGSSALVIGFVSGIKGLRWIGKAAEVAWNFATFFVVPLIAIEGLNAEAARKRSFEFAKGDIMTKEEIVKSAVTDPAAVRQLLKDPEVKAALEAIGAQLTVYELHAPAPSARTSTGLGQTLCGDRARRHSTLVTCKKCLKKRG